MTRGRPVGVNRKGRATQCGTTRRRRGDEDDERHNVTDPAPADDTHSDRTGRPAPGVASRRYSLVLLFRCACISFFSSSGVSFGRSIDSVILLILPVNANGTW